MIHKIENIAEKLIPYRKWMFIVFLFSFLFVMPIFIFLTIYFKIIVFFLIGQFVATMGFVWSWGLFLISSWYNPKGGFLTKEKINETHPFFQVQANLMRYVALVMLTIWFLSPFLILGIIYLFMKTIEK